MTKLLPATCEGSEVTCEGQVIEAVIVSQGSESSSGVVLIDSDKAYYIANISPDLSTIITDLSTMLNSIASLFTSIGSGMTGGSTAPPPTLASDVASLQNKISELDQLGENLR